MRRVRPGGYLVEELLRPRVEVGPEAAGVGGVGVRANVLDRDVGEQLAQIAPAAVDGGRRDPGSGRHQGTVSTSRPTSPRRSRTAAWTAPAPVRCARRRAIGLGLMQLLLGYVKAMCLRQLCSEAP